MGNNELKERTATELVFASPALFDQILHYLSNFIYEGFETNHNRLDPFYARWLCNTRFVNQNFSKKIDAFLLDNVRFAFTIFAYSGPLVLHYHKHLEYEQRRERSREWLTWNVKRIKNASVYVDDARFDHTHINAMTNLRCLHLTVWEPTINVDQLPRTLNELQLVCNKHLSKQHISTWAFVTGTSWPPDLTTLSIFSPANECFAPKETIEAIGSLDWLHTLILATYGPKNKSKPWFHLNVPDSLRRLHVHPRYITKEYDALTMNDGIENLTLDVKTKSTVTHKAIELNRSLPKSLKHVKALYNDASPILQIVSNQEELNRTPIVSQECVVFVERGTSMCIWPPSLVHLFTYALTQPLDVDELPPLLKLRTLYADMTQGLLTMEKFPDLRRYSELNYAEGRVLDFKEGLATLHLDWNHSVSDPGIKALPNTLRHLRCSATTYKALVPLVHPNLRSMEITMFRGEIETFGLDLLPKGLLAFKLTMVDALPSDPYLKGLLPSGLKFLFVKGCGWLPFEEPLPKDLEYLRARFYKHEAEQLGSMQNLSYLNAKCINGKQFVQPADLGIVLNPNVETRRPKLFAYTDTQMWFGGFIYHAMNDYNCGSNCKRFSTTFTIDEFACHSIIKYMY